MTTQTGRLLDVSHLIARAQDGCPEAMHELLSHLRPLVVRYCRGKLASYPGGRETSDDVAQEICVGVFHALPHYRDQGAPFMAWVYGIAANKVADAQRRFGRARHVPVDELTERAEPSPTPEEHLLATADLTTAAGLIERLPARDRQVLWMRATGATAEDIGEALGLSANTARVTLHRALGRLRKLAAGQGEIPV